MEHYLVVLKLQLHSQFLAVDGVVELVELFVDLARAQKCEEVGVSAIVKGHRVLLHRRELVLGKTLDNCFKLVTPLVLRRLILHPLLLLCLSQALRLPQLGYDFLLFLKVQLFLLPLDHLQVVLGELFPCAGIAEGRIVDPRVFFELLDCHPLPRVIAEEPKYKAVEVRTHGINVNALLFESHVH